RTASSLAHLLSAPQAASTAGSPSARKARLCMFDFPRSGSGVGQRQEHQHDNGQGTNPGRSLDEAGKGRLLMTDVHFAVFVIGDFVMRGHDPVRERYDASG